jgi:hypothetical protein
MHSNELGEGGQPREVRNLREPDQRDVRELHDPETVERRAPDHRVAQYTLTLPSANTALSWIDRIAVLAHEASRIWDLLHGDTSKPSYVNATDEARASLHQGVQDIVDGKISTPEESHEAWLRFKESGGWKYGPVKDVAARTHPCFVPYTQLPPEQRAKDAIFFGIVTGLVAEYQHQAARANNARL